MSSRSRTQELSDIIAKNTEIVNSYLEENKLPTPSLDADAIWSIPIPDHETETKDARLAVIEACSELQALITGPKELLHFPVSPILSR